MTADKRIAYGYLFNYFGGEKRNGKIVNGSSIDLNIRPYILISEIRRCYTVGHLHRSK